MKDFSPTFYQFKNKPVKAIQFLMQIKKGQAVDALFRSDIGFIDIIWGNNQLGLCHIINKHGKEIEQLGFSIENFIPIIIQFGELKPSVRKDRILLEGNMFRAVISLEYMGREKKFLLSAFDLRKNKKTFEITGTIGGNNFTNNPLHYLTNVSWCKDNILS